MNTPHGPPPLDPDERELARIYRALPDGEPPPALDARIRAAAREAVAPAPGRRVRPWPWGLSAAAAALLALALFWQAGLPPQRELSDEFGEPVDALPEQTFRDAPAPGKPEAQETAGPGGEGVELDRIEVSGTRVTSEQEQAPQFVPDAPPPARQRAADEAKAGLRREAPAAAAEPQPRVPPPPPPSPAAAPPAPAARATPAPRELEERTMQSGAGADAGADSDARLKANERARRDGAAPSPDAAPEAMQAPVPLGFARELPPLADDARLAPGDWLDRIRTRLEAGDREGARASLQRFRAEHPAYELPDELRALLEEAPR